MEVLSFPPCKPPPPDWLPSAQAAVDPHLAAWLAETQPAFADAATGLRRWHRQRVALLESAAGAARRDLWWPFTQHDSVGRRQTAGFVSFLLGLKPDDSSGCPQSPEYRTSQCSGKTADGFVPAVRMNCTSIKLFSCKLFS